MKKLMIKVLSLAMLTGTVCTTAVHADSSEQTCMWRLYNPNSGEHFYTGNDNEMLSLQDYGWKVEGVGWYAPKDGNPVYRLYNGNAGDHHYTLSADERDMLVKAGWKYEGIGWYSDPDQEVALYREYNPNSGRHNYTTNFTEHQALVSYGWKDEGTAWFGESYIDTSGVPDDGKFKYTGIVFDVDNEVYRYQEKEVYVSSKAVYYNGKAYYVDANGVLDSSKDIGMKASIEAIRLYKEGHPYSNEVRWGPSYDCSSLVLTCYKNVGVNIGNATYTKNMVEELSKVGFTVYENPDEIDWLPGDIFLDSLHLSHTEILIGAAYDGSDTGVYALSVDTVPESGIRMRFWDGSRKGNYLIRYTG